MAVMRKMWQRVKLGLVAYQTKPTKLYHVKWGWKRTTTPREKWNDAIDWSCASEPQIHYDQIRPIDEDMVISHQLPMTTDCSGWFVNLCRAAGLADPSGFGFDGRGDTASIRAHLPKCPLDQADAIVYGRPDNHPGQHIVAVRRKATNPQCGSHGQERGPILIDHLSELRAHDGYYTAHRVPGLGN